MKGRIVLFLGLAAGLAAGWLAFDPPAPKRAGAMSYQPPAERTGAPNELLCTECHAIPAETPDGSASIDVPAEYDPNSTYTITVTLQDPGQLRWGFEAIAYRVDEQTLTLKMAGSFTNLSALTTIQELGDGRQYVSHTSNQGNVGEPDGTFMDTANGPVTWSFSWTAPSAGSGPVVWYVAGNAANGNLNPSGDFIYTAMEVSDEAPTTAVEQTTWGKIKMKYR